MKLRTGRLALVAAAIGWLPLALLVIARSGSAWSGDVMSFWPEIGVHTRQLLSVPLLLIADGTCMPRLTRIVLHFANAGLVPDHDRERFDAAVASARALLESMAAKVVIVLLAYGFTALIVVSVPANQIPAWHLSSGAPAGFSPAGWWHVAVSLPLVLVLILGWMWRLFLWARLLQRIARCRLRLIASHPDRTAGLSFLGNSLRAFAPIALAFSAIAASRSATVVLAGGSLPTPRLYFNLGFLVFVLVLFAAPLFVFSPTLMKTGRYASLAYGALAQRMGQTFERKWLGGRAPPDDEMLAVQDFSATTDLYQVVANARGIRFAPFGLRDLIPLAVALVAPFVPVVLLTVPIETIWSGVKGLLF